MAWRYTNEKLARILGVQPPSGTGEFQGVSTDTRVLSPRCAFFALKGPNFDANDFIDEAFERGAAAVVASDTTSDPRCIRVSDPLDALQKFALHHRRQQDVRVLALTGSCGKTSAKEMVAALLSTRYETIKTQGNLNNEIGCPLSILRVESETEWAVLEMGANHRGEIAELCTLALPCEGAITMVAPAHLEGFGSVDDIAAAKEELVEALPASGTFYVNADDPYCQEMADRFDGEKIFFGRKGDPPVESIQFDEHGEMQLQVGGLGMLRLPLYAPAFAANVALAIAVGLRHGVDEFEGPLRAACESTSRCTLRRIGSFTIIDDTYNANPASMRAALDALAQQPCTGVRIAALGDMLELGEQATQYHEEVGEYAAQLNVDCVYAYGAYAESIVNGAHAGGVADALTFDSHEALAKAAAESMQGGGVLLVKGSRGVTMENVITSFEEIAELAGGKSL